MGTLSTATPSRSKMSLAVNCPVPSLERDGDLLAAQVVDGGDAAARDDMHLFAVERSHVGDLVRQAAAERIGGLGMGQHVRCHDGHVDAAQEQEVAQVREAAFGRDRQEAQLAAAGDGSRQIVGHRKIAGARPARRDDQRVVIELQAPGCSGLSGRGAASGRGGGLSAGGGAWPAGRRGRRLRLSEGRLAREQDQCSGPAPQCAYP